MIMTIEKFKEKMSIKFPNENYTIIYVLFWYRIFLL